MHTVILPQGCDTGPLAAWAVTSKWSTGICKRSHASISVACTGIQSLFASDNSFVCTYLKAAVRAVARNQLVVHVKVDLSKILSWTSALWILSARERADIKIFPLYKLGGEAYNDHWKPSCGLKQCVREIVSPKSYNVSTVLLVLKGLKASYHRWSQPLKI